MGEETLSHYIQIFSLQDQSLGHVCICFSVDSDRSGWTNSVLPFLLLKAGPSPGGSSGSQSSRAGWSGWGAGARRCCFPLPIAPPGQGRVFSSSGVALPEIAASCRCVWRQERPVMQRFPKSSITARGAEVSMATEVKIVQQLLGAVRARREKSWDVVFGERGSPY